MRILYLAVAAIVAAATLSAQATRPPTALTADTAGRFPKLALACVRQEYPNKITHVLNSAADAKPPHELTPAF